MTLHLRGRSSFGLLLLSAIWACGWLLPELLPSVGRSRISVPPGQAIVFSILAAAIMLAGLRRKQTRWNLRAARAWALVSLGLFVLPAAASALAQNSLSDYDKVAVLCLTPMFAITFEPYLQRVAPRRGKGASMGALLGIAGVLVLIPLDAPHSAAAWVALLVLLLTTAEIAAINCTAVRLACEVQQPRSLPFAFYASAAAAFSFGVVALLTPKKFWGTDSLAIYLVQSCLDLAGLLLLFWLLPRMAASRMTARFLLTPLFAATLGALLELRLPPLRSLGGMALLAAGAGWLVFAPAESDEPDLLSIRSMTDEARIDR